MLNDWSSSMWKVDRIVVTCLQSHERDELGVSPRGEHVDRSFTTKKSSQWHFVPREKWIGPRPASTKEQERRLADKMRDFADQQAQLERLVSF